MSRLLKVTSRNKVRLFYCEACEPKLKQIQGALHWLHLNTSMSLRIWRILIRSKKSADQSEILLPAGSQRCEAGQSDTISLLSLFKLKLKQFNPGVQTLICGLVPKIELKFQSTRNWSYRVFLWTQYDKIIKDKKEEHYIGNSLCHAITQRIPKPLTQNFDLQSASRNRKHSRFGPYKDPEFFSPWKDEPSAELGILRTLCN